MRDGFSGVYILVTIINGSIMAAVYTTRASAMTAAVDWVEGEAETHFAGSLEECYQMAQRQVEKQDGQMKIVISPMLSSEP